jgi:hypothetical protein
MESLVDAWLNNEHLKEQYWFQRIREIYKDDPSGKNWNYFSDEAMEAIAEEESLAKRFTNAPTEIKEKVLFLVAGLKLKEYDDQFYFHKA